jgi:hypothetical protein
MSDLNHLNLLYHVHQEQQTANLQSFFEYCVSLVPMINISRCLCINSTQSDSVITCLRATSSNLADQISVTFTIL